MVAKATKLENSLRRKHEEIFAKLKFEREKMISELQSAWKQKASEEELASFEEAARSYKTAQAKLYDVYEKHEAALKADLEKARQKALEMDLPDVAAASGKARAPAPEGSKAKDQGASASAGQAAKDTKEMGTGSNMEDTDESEMTSSSVEDYVPHPESALQDHELPTSGSESSLGEEDLTSKAQEEAESVIKSHGRGWKE